MIDAAIRFALSQRSSKGSKRRLQVLAFHRVLPKADPLFPEVPDAVRFTQQMQWVRSWCEPVPLTLGARLLREGRLPERALAITFDDGYADNVEVAAPILHKLGLPATFFVATGFLDGGRMWNDRVIGAIRSCGSERIDLAPLGLGSMRLSNLAERRTAIESVIRSIKHRTLGDRNLCVQKLEQICGKGDSVEPMMCADQLHQLRRLGMTIGAHTVNHPILASISIDDARREILESKTALESMLGVRIGEFAYPNGVPERDYTSDHVALVRDAGFDVAVSTAPGTAVATTDPLQLPRFAPWDRSRIKYGLRLLRNLSHSQVAADSCAQL